MTTKILLIALLFITSSLSAEVKDKWKISMGSMFVTEFETEMQLTAKTLPLAARINTVDQLGMKSDTNVFRLDGYYRFNDTHSIDFSYFTVKSSGEKDLTAAIEFDGKDYIIGEVVKSYFDMDIYKINYGYSFYHNEKVELMLTAGLHITTVDLGLGSDSTGSSSGAIIPLPVVGFKGQYTIIDKKLFVEYRSDYFMLKYNNIEGSLLSSTFNIEYRFVDHVGVGLGYNANNIFVSADDGNKKLEVENSLAGAMLYLTYIY